MTCDLYCGDGAACLWCSHPAEAHRFVECRRCGGWPFLPDPTDRRPLPIAARRWVRCGCSAVGRFGGWMVRETGKPAEDAALEAVGWKVPGRPVEVAV